MPLRTYLFGMSLAEKLALGTGFGLFVFVAGLVVVRWLLVSLPCDHFIKSEPQRTGFVRVARQVGGVVLVLLGVLMLVLPGPGIVTIALGVALFDSAKKHEVLRKILSGKRVREALDDLRARAKKGPFILGTEPPFV